MIIRIITMILIMMLLIMINIICLIQILINNSWAGSWDEPRQEIGHNFERQETHQVRPGIA